MEKTTIMTDKETGRVYVAAPDGCAYWIRTGERHVDGDKEGMAILAGAPMFKDGGVDWDSFTDVDDYAEPLAKSVISGILCMLSGGIPCSGCPRYLVHAYGTGAWYASDAAKSRLEYLRQELRAERLSYGEISELQSLAPYIAPDDVELLEAAGVPEHPEQ